jgi:TPR-GreAB-C-PIN type conflict system protein
MLALAEALMRRRQPEPGATHLGDYRRAALLAKEARAARRRYRADSVPAATILLHALNLGGDERSAIRVAQPAPDGDATEAEAASPGLAFYAARLCYETGDIGAGDRFEATIARSSKAEWITQCAAVKASNCGASPAEQINRWQEFLATGAPDDQRLVALTQLADLGVWPLPDLERLRDTGFLTEGTYDTVHAQALAATDRQPEALALLRRASKASIVAAEFYARQLAGLGHVDDSVQVCDEAALRFGDPRPELLALDVLTHAGRTDDVITRVAELLSRDDLPSNLRHRVRTRLVEVHATRCDWLKCEKLARAGLAETQRLLHDQTVPGNGPVEIAPPALSDLRTWQQNHSWAIIFSQLHRNQSDEAFRTLTQLAPEPVSLADIATWTDLHRAHGWTPSTAQQALALATRYDVLLAVAAPIFLSLMQTCRTEPAASRSDDEAAAASGLYVTVSKQFHQQLTEAWAGFLERYPAAVRTLNSEDPRFAEQVRDLLLSHAIRYDHARESVRAGRLPLGVLSAASGKPYLLSLVQHAAGLIPAVTATPEAHERETNAARDALGKTIAIEGSALYLASAATRLRPAAIDVFLKILLPEPSARDAVRSHSAVRDSANTAGGLGTDPRSGDLHLAPLDEATRLHALEATEKALQASQECRSAVVTDTATFGTSLNADTISPWLAPVAVAIENNIALYSDDAHIRRLATYFGVPAFGSLALIEALLDAERIDAEAAEAIIGDLFCSNVVDLPNVWPLLARTAQTYGATTQPVLTNLTRTAFWRDIGEGNVVRVIATLAQYLEREPPAVEAFTAAAALGLATTFGPPERVLAILGTVLILTGTDLSPESAEPTLRAIRQLASRYGWDPIPSLREQLVETLSGPDDTFAMSPENAEQTAARILGDAQMP